MMCRFRCVKIFALRIASRWLTTGAMTRALQTRGYGFWLVWTAKALRPERLPTPPARPYEQRGLDWVLALIAVFFLAGTLLVEAIRLRG
jgi:hypothetical protein